MRPLRNADQTPQRWVPWHVPGSCGFWNAWKLTFTGPRTSYFRIHSPIFTNITVSCVTSRVQLSHQYFLAAPRSHQIVHLIVRPAPPPPSLPHSKMKWGKKNLKPHSDHRRSTCSSSSQCTKRTKLQKSLPSQFYIEKSMWMLKAIESNSSKHFSCPCFRGDVLCFLQSSTLFYLNLLELSQSLFAATS